LDLQIVFPHSGHFSQDDDVVVLPEHVERWVGASGARARAEPTTGAECVKSLLELNKRVERV
jgi:hypothetical protein